MYFRRYGQENPVSIFGHNAKGSRKKGAFYGQADRKGGERVNDTLLIVEEFVNFLFDLLLMFSILKLLYPVLRMMMMTCLYIQ